MSQLSLFFLFFSCSVNPNASYFFQKLMKNSNLYRSMVSLKSDQLTSVCYRAPGWSSDNHLTRQAQFQKVFSSSFIQCFFSLFFNSENSFCLHKSLMHEGIVWHHKPGQPKTLSHLELINMFFNS